MTITTIHAVNVWAEKQKPARGEEEQKPRRSAEAGSYFSWVCVCVLLLKLSRCAQLSVVYVNFLERSLHLGFHITICLTNNIHLRWSKAVIKARSAALPLLAYGGAFCYWSVDEHK